MTIGIFLTEMYKIKEHKYTKSEEFEVFVQHTWNLSWCNSSSLFTWYVSLCLIAVSKVAASKLKSVMDEFKLKLN